MEGFLLSDNPGTIALVACHLVFAVSWIGLISSPRSGSPQPAKTTARTASRSLTTEAKSIPDGWMASAMATLTELHRGNHWSPRSIERVPRMIAGTTGSCRLRGDPEGTEIEARKPRAARKGTLRKKHQQAPLPRGVGDAIEVGKAVGHLESFEKQNPKAPQQRPGKNLACELLLDDVGGLAREEPRPRRRRPCSSRD